MENLHFIKGMENNARLTSLFDTKPSITTYPKSTLLSFVFKRE